MNACILDFETNGLDPQKALPLEFAALVVDEKWEVRGMFGDYFRYYTAIDLPDEITKLTGITMETLSQLGQPSERNFEVLLDATKKCSYFIAHNAEFDSKILACSVQDLDARRKFPAHPAFDTDNWICTVKDVPYPEAYRCKKLGHLAFDHGVWPLPGQRPHTAKTDVDLIRRMMISGGYSLDQILNFRTQPFIYLVALIPPPWEDNGAGKDAAKKDGYYFQQCPGDNRKFEKKWIKKIRESELSKEKAKKDLSFKREIVRAENVQTQPEY